jgi:hypothetical protein
LQKHPIVLFAEKLVQTGKKPGDELFLFFRCLGLRNIDRAGVIQPAFVLGFALLGNRNPGMILFRALQRNRQRHQVFSFEMNQRGAISA